MKTFFTHANRGRPFKVSIEKKASYYKILIYKALYDNVFNEIYSDDPSLVLRCKKTFIGKSSSNMLRWVDDTGKDCDGNSILLQMSNFSYVFIGDSVFSFKTKGIIVKYFSPVGNNDVPYPYAVDEYGNYYLLIEDVSFNMERNEEELPFDPYDYYYKNRLICDDIAGLSDKDVFKGKVIHEAPLKHFMNISSFYIGSERYNFTWKPFPTKNYKWVTGSAFEGDGSISVQLVSGKMNKLSKEEFIYILKSFGKQMGFHAIQQKKILLKRRL